MALPVPAVLRLKSLSKSSTHAVRARPGGLVAREHVR
jgi:hypothetical protein